MQASFATRAFGCRGAGPRSVSVIRRPTRCNTLAAGRDTVPAEPQTATSGTQVKPSNLRKIRDLPVEAGLPLVGKALDLVKHDFEMETMFDKHKTDMLWVNCGPIGGWCLMIRDPDDIEEVLVTKGNTDAYILKWPDGPAKMILPLERTIAVHEAKVLRKAITRMVSAESVAVMHVPLVGEKFTSMMRKIVDSGEEVLWDHVSRRVSYDVAVQAVLGDFLTKEDIDFLFPYAVTNQHAAFSLNYGFENGFPGSLYNQGMKAKWVMQEYMADRLEVALEAEIARGTHTAADHTPSIITKFITCLGEEGYDVYKDGCTRTAAEDLAREIVMLNFAATENSSYLLCNAIMLLAQHPEWLDAIYDEQKVLMEEYGEDNFHRRVVSRSNIAVACAQEAMRLKPPLKLLFRTADEDTSCGDVAVPKGTSVALAIRQAIRESGSGGYKFDPTQWLTTEGDGRMVCKPNHNKGNFVWGRGQRKCIGQHLAHVELALALVTIARQVKEIQMSSEEMHRDYFVVGPHPTGLPVKFIARDRPEPKTPGAETDLNTTTVATAASL